MGAPAPGGLALPAASPTRATLYGPRGAHLDDNLLVVADSGNHRVLIWHGVPEHDHAPADVVLGQPDATTEGPAAGGRGPERGFHLPTGVTVIDGHLVVADAWHHRLLVYDGVPERDDAPPIAVIGQPDLAAVEANRGGEVTASGFFWPFGIALIGGDVWVADTGNRRVLGWRGGLPLDPRPADVVLGQPSHHDHEENRGGPVSARSFRWPHAFAGDATTLLVADAGNHRVVGWRPLPGADCDANVVVGQPTFDSASEWPYGPQGGARMRFPYGVDADDDVLVVADTSNNRVLVFDGLPRPGAGESAVGVLGQRDFDANGENRWEAVGPDTLCWPYGISLNRGTVAVADSGNNRVMLWGLEAS